MTHRLGQFVIVAVPVHKTEAALAGLPRNREPWRYTLARMEHRRHWRWSAWRGGPIFKNVHSIRFLDCQIDQEAARAVWSRIRGPFDAYCPNRLLERIDMFARVVG